jgi:hypothetical protein
MIYRADRQYYGGWQILLKVEAVMVKYENSQFWLWRIDVGFSEYTSYNNLVHFHIQNSTRNNLNLIYWNRKRNWIEYLCVLKSPELKTCFNKDQQNVVLFDHYKRILCGVKKFCKGKRGLSTLFVFRMFPHTCAVISIVSIVLRYLLWI